MGAASYLQTSFLGGEWAPSAQGRADNEEYRSALNLCYNGLPTEVGAWTRRPGTRLYGPTRSGLPGILREFHFTQSASYLMEFTDSHLRFHKGPVLVTEPVVSVASFTHAATPHGITNVAALGMTPQVDPGWSIGDTVVFNLIGPPVGGQYGDVAAMLNRQFVITRITQDHSGTINTYIMVDALLGTFDMNRVNVGSNAIVASRVKEFATPYLQGDLASLRTIQDETQVVVLQPKFAPYLLTNTVPEAEAVEGFAQFSYSKASFNDGPYLDPPTDGTTLTASASGSLNVILAASKQTSINDGKGFKATDVGRLIRLFSEPPAYDKTHNYAAGDSVSYAGLYFTAITGGTGKQPDISINNWAIATAAAIWTWGTITAVTGPTSVSVTLAAADPDQVKAGGPLLYTTPIRTWRLGLYSDTTGWPSCGTFHEGRIWLAGPGFPNRMDGSQSNEDLFAFAPTLYDGTVADDCGISAVFRSDDINTILWMLPDHSGIVIGTQAGEWAVQASSLSDPITPTSIQAHRVTKFGAENVEPRRTGMATVFVRRFGRKLTEYISDVYSGKYSGTNLSLKAAHLMSDSPIAELAYQQETTPVVWARLEDGQLLGMTYRRDSPFGTQPASFSAWHQHGLGTGETVLSIQGGPSIDGDRDTLNMLTQDPTTGYCYVQALADLFGEHDALPQAWFLDGAVSPTGVDYFVTGTGNFLRFYGLDYWIGKTVTAWIGGIDGGDYVIPPGGTLDVPIDVNPANDQLTAANLGNISQFNYAASVPTYQIGTATAVSYHMELEENYGPLQVAQLGANQTTQHLHTAQMYPGLSFDPIRRKIMYLCVQGNDDGTGPNNTGGYSVNASGYELWSGYYPHAPGDGLNTAVESNLFICEKDVDTGEVVFYNPFNINNTVPPTVQPPAYDNTKAYGLYMPATGSDGKVYYSLGDTTGHDPVTDVSHTYWQLAPDFSNGDVRRFVFDFQTSGYLPTSEAQNGWGLVDPRTGNYWPVSASCELYCFPLASRFSQTISPLPPQHKRQNLALPIGMTDDWVFVKETDIPTTQIYLHLTPRIFTATEITRDYILPYASYPYPVGAYGNYCREVFDAKGNMYLFVATKSGGKNYKLYQFVPPTAKPADITYPTPPGDGGFVDVTMWASGGPNGDTTSYTLAATNNGPQVVDDPLWAGYIPATDTLVLLEKSYSSEKTLNTYNPADFFVSATQVHYPTGFFQVWEHYSKFLTGYMAYTAATDLAPATFVTTNAAGATHAINEWLETNPFLNRHDYQFPGQSYGTRRFYLICSPVSGGVVDTNAYNQRIVIVDIAFVYGQAPTIVQVVDEAPWVTAYQNYKNALQHGDAAVIQPSMAEWKPVYGVDGSVVSFFDKGLNDPVTNTDWWSGQDANENLLWAFSDYYGNRWHGPASSPFLKIWTERPPIFQVPITLGFTYTSKAQILRPVVPQESGARNGPAQGKTRRTHQFAALMTNTQGISFGTDFDHLNAALFESPGGIRYTVLQMWNGVWWSTLDDSYSFDSMPCWEITRPYPATVVSFEGYLHTQDR